MGNGTDQHLALLIQNEQGKWQYFSVNGDNVYVPLLNIHIGGRTFDDLFIGEFDSPQQFLESTYNSKGDKNDKSVNKYEFTEGYILPTTSEQDEIIKQTFIKISEKEDYSIFNNNCATAVQRSLNAVGIKTAEKKIVKTNIGIITKESTTWIPSKSFKMIMENNPNGTYIQKKK